MAAKRRCVAWKAGRLLRASAGWLADWLTRDTVVVLMVVAQMLLAVYMSVFIIVKRCM